MTLGKSLDIEPDVPEIGGRQIHRANASASTLSIITSEIRLSFLDHLIEGLNIRFDKYGSMIHKMHAFVPSVIRMGKVQLNYKIEKISHGYRDNLPTARNAF